MHRSRGVMITEEHAGPMLTDRSASDFSLSGTSDPDLLEAWHRDRNHDSFAALVRRYGVMVMSVCHRRCRSTLDAEDAFQTTFLYLAGNAHKIRHPERLPGWLHRVAQRAAIATASMEPHETPSSFDVPAALDDPLERLARRHEAIILDEELADLPERYRAALVMHILEGQTLAQMADQFGTTIGTLRGRLQRGKQLLTSRLRRRGVVPVIAFASAAYCSVPAATAASVEDRLIDSLDTGQLPPSPTPISSLEPLLHQGFQLMKMPFVSSAIVISTLIAGLFIAGSLGAQNTPAEDRSLILFQAAQASPDSSLPNASVQVGNANMAPTPLASPSASEDKTMMINKLVQPTPDSQVARDAADAMQHSFTFEGKFPLREFPAEMSRVIGVPVYLDNRAVEFAELEASAVSLHFDGLEKPLSTSLYQTLHPLGLKAIVRNQGVVITADKVELARRGIGVSKWINVDESAARNIERALEQPTTLIFAETPLIQALEEISSECNLPIGLDRAALEGIGLTDDTPVSLALKDTKLRTVLESLLNDLDLTLTIQREYLKVTSQDSADESLLTRLYFLAGAGFPRSDLSSAMQMIQTACSPDCWEALGGVSTMVPMDNGEEGCLFISTTYGVHHEIEQLLATLRETNFGEEPIIEQVEVPIPPQFNGGGMGGGGLGGGGGMF